MLYINLSLKNGRKNKKLKGVSDWNKKNKKPFTLTLFLPFSKEQNPYLKFGIQLYEDAKGRQIQEELTPIQTISLEKEIMQKFFFFKIINKRPWRRKWQPTPVFLPEKSHWQKSLLGYEVAKSQTQLKQLSINKRVMRELIICRKPKRPCSVYKILVWNLPKS